MRRVFVTGILCCGVLFNGTSWHRVQKVELGNVGANHGTSWRGVQKVGAWKRDVKTGVIEVARFLPPLPQRDRAAFKLFGEGGLGQET